MIADLHTHSYYSDGTQICDHNSIDNFQAHHLIGLWCYMIEILGCHY